MKINRLELLSALDKVKGGLAQKEMIEQTTHFAFADQKVMTYNDEISISHPVDGLELEGAVKAEELYSLLSKIKQGEIEIEVKEEELHINAGKTTRAGIAFQPEVKLPMDELGKIGKWRNLPDNLIPAMTFCMFACSKDMSTPVYTCVNVGQEGMAESTDRLRVTRHKIGELPEGIQPFLIPATSVQYLTKYSITKMASSKGWVHFQTEDGGVFSCRVYDDSFPDIDKLFDLQGTEIKLPKKLEEVLERASIFAKRDISLDEEVAIKLESKKMEISSTSDTGWIKEKMAVKYSDEPVKFSVHPSILREIIEHGRQPTIGESVLKFAGDNWEHVIAIKCSDD